MTSLTFPIVLPFPSADATSDRAEDLSLSSRVLLLPVLLSPRAESRRSLVPLSRAGGPHIRLFAPPHDQMCSRDRTKPHISNQSREFCRMFPRGRIPGLPLAGGWGVEKLLFNGVIIVKIDFG